MLGDREHAGFQVEVPRPVVEIYETWCQWLDIPEENFPLGQVVQMLAQGGETFRSFLQFLARLSEPHRREPCDNEEDSLRRSCMAMQVLVHALAGPGSPLGGGCVLAAVCYELLGGLQPRSRGSSMHICTVLHHLLLFYDHEVCSLLLQYHAPFVLLRALDRPGCPELLRGFIISCDTALPQILPMQFRPLRTVLMQQVLQYLLANGWPQLVAALLEQGVKLNSSVIEDQENDSPMRNQVHRLGSPLQNSPVRRPSLHAITEWSSPCPRGTPQLLSTPGSTPLAKVEMSPLSSLAAPPSSPSPSHEPCFKELPAFPFSGSLGRVHEAPGSSPCRPSLGSGKELPTALASPCSNLQLSPSHTDELEQPQEGGEGVGVLIEFLASSLEIWARGAEAISRSKSQDEEAELRAQARWSLLRNVFLETPLVSHLFGLVRQGSVQFESALLLNALLQNALHPRLLGKDFADPLVAQCLPHVEGLGLMLLGSVKGSRKASKRSPVDALGALRVAVVQILAALCELAPDRVMPLVKPSVWGLLVEWFLAHRCNHIFQATCGRLWIAVVEHGGSRLQHYVLSRCKLLQGLCDIVLAEGACGDSWQELKSVSCSPKLAGARVEKAQVAVRKTRHPGGLGGIVPVIWALAAKEKQEESVTEAQKVGSVATVRRPPLGERPVPQVPRTDTSKMSAESVAVAPVSQLSSSYLPRLLATTSTWQQVLKAVGTPAPVAVTSGPRC